MPNRLYDSNTLYDLMDQITYRCDQHVDPRELSEIEEFWFQWFTESVKSSSQDYKGIGNLNNPEYVLVVEKIQIPNRWVKGIREHPYWELPYYSRLRPFMETKKSLKFFYNLLRQVKLFTPQNSWITTYDKIWLSKRDSADLWKQELESLNKQKIKRTILLGEFFPIPEGLDWISFNLAILKWPSFHTTTHNLEWSDFRYKFWKLINQ